MKSPWGWRSEFGELEFVHDPAPQMGTVARPDVRLSLDELLDPVPQISFGSAPHPLQMIESVGSSSRQLFSHRTSRSALAEWLVDGPSSTNEKPAGSRQSGQINWSIDRS